jgi:hypothetical protein
MKLFLNGVDYYFDHLNLTGFIFHWFKPCFFLYLYHFALVYVNLDRRGNVLRGK